MFSQVSVCPRGGGLSAPLHAGIHPPTRGRHPPGPDTSVQCMLGDTGNKWAVRILLECIPFLPPAMKLGQGYVFKGVCDSVHRGGVPDQVPPRPARYIPPPPGTRYTPWTRHPPRTRYPPGPGMPPRTRHTTPQTRYTPPRTRHTPQTRYTPQTRNILPQDQVHPPPPRPGTAPTDQVPPWCRARWEIRSTRGRYASYWNAILFPCIITSMFPLSRRTQDGFKCIEIL